jgi:hypothetical protein
MLLERVDSYAQKTLKIVTFDFSIAANIKTKNKMLR